MFIKQHMVSGALAGAVVSWYASPIAGVSLLAGSVLIDADHYLWYAVAFKDLSLIRAARFFEAKEADKYYCLCILHTFEAMIVYTACMLSAQGAVFWIAAGCMTHMALDIAQSVRDKGFFKRQWSLTHAVLVYVRGK